MSYKPGKLFMHLFPPFLAVAILTLSIVALTGYGFLDRLLMKDEIRDLETQGQILSSEFRFLLSSGRESWIDRRCESLGRKTGYRYTVILPDGWVVGDSILGVPEAENHLERPEVKKALTGAVAGDLRTSRSTGEKYLFVAVPLDPSALRGVLRIARRFDVMTAIVRTTYFRFLMGLLLILGVALLFSLELARKVTRKLVRPLERMVSFLFHVGNDGTAREVFDESGVPAEFKEVQETTEEVLGRLKGTIAGLRQRGDDLRNRANDLDRVAHYDPLTGLPNRAKLYPAMEEAVNRAAEEGSRLAVLFFDLDRFKGVNDTYGHETGDILLQMLAERLKTTVEERGMTARLGGDEFCVLLERIDDRGEVVSLAQSILDETGRPFEIEGHRLEMTISIGISLFPQDGSSRQELLHAADMAMYGVKRAGRAGFAFFREREILVK